MAKSKKKRPKKTARKRKQKQTINPQTNQPFEQDSKRRIGPYGGAGEPPRMQ